MNVHKRAIKNPSRNASLPGSSWGRTPWWPSRSRPCSDSSKESPVPTCQAPESQPCRRKCQDKPDNRTIEVDEEDKFRVRRSYCFSVANHQGRQATLPEATLGPRVWHSSLLPVVQRRFPCRVPHLALYPPLSQSLNSLAGGFHYSAQTISVRDPTPLRGLLT